MFLGLGRNAFRNCGPNVTMPPKEPSGAISLALNSFLCGLRRLAGAVDAFLLKIVIEERLGYPVYLISDGLATGVESALNLTGPKSVYAALASGDADFYPEVMYPEICFSVCARVRARMS
jgi:hypothetical protein